MSKLAAQATRDLRQIILDALGRAVAEKSPSYGAGAGFHH